MEGGAKFSLNRRYRYSLWRQWDINRPAVTFICLNPSTADEEVNDPTVRRCITFAHAWGFGTCYLGNIFALRGTNPSVLYDFDDPIGPDNDTSLLDMSSIAARVVVGWGNRGQLYNRGNYVLELISSKRPLYCFGRTKTGEPKHPLYLPRLAMVYQLGGEFDKMLLCKVNKHDYK